MRRLVGVLLPLCLLAAWVGVATAQDAAPWPVVDTHIHYNRETWRVFSTEDALALMDEAGIQWALVSSTPDDGTLWLYERAPSRVVPMLRPYRTAADFATWTTDQEVLDEIERRLDSGVPYRGIGEFELEPGQAHDPVPRRLADLAAERGLWLHAHADAVAIVDLAGLRPDTRILWAHAGVNASPEVVADTLAAHPNVWVELSLRAAELTPQSDAMLDPTWFELLTRFADRILLGSDTWLPPDWAALPRTHASLRAALHQLPPDVAIRIASRNAESLFGAP